jgi:hypothetical protein
VENTGDGLYRSKIEEAAAEIHRDR